MDQSTTKKMLVTRPTDDFATRYLSTWAKKVIEFAQQKNFSVMDLYREKANRKQVESMLEKRNPTLVFLNGHGSHESVCGHDQEYIICSDDNEHLLEGKIVYAVACSSNFILGPKSVKKGAKAYIGYHDVFISLHNPEKQTKPLEDKVAEMILDPSNLIVTSLIKNNTVKLSIENSKNSARRTIRKILASRGDIQIAKVLLWNMEHISSSGDYNATL